MRQQHLLAAANEQDRAVCASVRGSQITESMRKCCRESSGYPRPHALHDRHRFAKLREALASRREREPVALDLLREPSRAKTTISDHP
jgi:hypothetical protein